MSGTLWTQQTDESREDAAEWERVCTRYPSSSAGTANPAGDDRVLSLCFHFNFISIKSIKELLNK